MALDLESITSLRDAIRRIAGGPEAGASKTLARCVSVDKDGTRWVRILGGDVDTPVNGTQLSEMSEGDLVEVDVSDGTLGIVGNVTSPSVGASKVREEIEPFVKRVERAESDTGAARQIADEASRVANAVNQHFFTDTNGIHVTDVTQEVWESDHSGPNILINSLGQLLRNGLNNLVSVTQSAIAFYDGAGNTAGNLVASFGGSGVMQYVGGMLRSALTAAGFDVYDADGTTRVAHFGTDSVIGATDAYNTLVDSSGFAVRSGQDEIVRMSGEVDAAGRRIGHVVVGDSSDGSVTALDGTVEDVDYGTYTLRRRTSSLKAHAPDGSDIATVSAWAQTASDGSMDECGVRLYGEQLNLAHGTSYSSVPMEQAARAVAAQSGTVTASTIGNVAAGSTSGLLSVTFPTEFDHVPNVIVGFRSTSSAGGFGACSVAVNSVTATGFTYRVFNADTQTRNPGIYWIAL